MSKCDDKETEGCAESQQKKKSKNFTVYVYASITQNHLILW